jgi:DNA-binding MarR family transcriptional regulator
VLAALDEYGPASQIDLGRRCGYDRSDMVAILNELAADHFVDRQEDTSDRRRNVVKITTAGRRRLRRLDSVADAIQDELLAPLAPRERKQLADLLRRVIDVS